MSFNDILTARGTMPGKGLPALLAELARPLVWRELMSVQPLAASAT
jgi:hypothetical protein